MSPLSMIRLSLVVLACAILPSQSQAQTQVPTPHQHLVSGSPLSLLADWFNGEYERKLTDRTSVGIAGGWLSKGDDDYTGVTGFLRYYPREAAFAGFYIGGQGGFFRVDDGEKESTPIGLGLDMGYGWLLGPEDSVYLGLGIGATRLFGGDLDHASATIPAIRLINIGIAF